MQVSLSTSAKPVFLSSSNLPLPLEFDLFQNAQEKKLLVKEEESLEFMGENGKNEVACKYFLGKKQDSKVILKELEVFKVSGKLKFKVKNSTEKISKNTLGSEFGSKKKKKEISLNSLNSVKTAQNSAQVLSSLNTLHSSSPETQSTGQFLLLKPNLETRDVALVYSLNGIIPENFLKNTVNLLDLQKILKDTGESRFLSEKITNMDNYSLKIAIYLRILQIFYKRRDSNATLPLPGTDAEIMEYLLQKFTEYSQGQGKYRFTPVLKDMILAEIGILALHLDNYNVVIQKLIQDLGISVGKMVKIYKELGVRINTVNKEKMAVLSLPLATPKTSLYG